LAPRINPSLASDSSSVDARAANLSWRKRPSSAPALKPYKSIGTGRVLLATEASFARLDFDGQLRRDAQSVKKLPSKNFAGVAFKDVSQKARVASLREEDLSHGSHARAREN
jgi:hypothetical protein